MTTTHPNETVIAVTPSSIEPRIERPPSIKRHVQLYRYGKSGLLGKKTWKEGNVIIYDDSTFKIFKDAEGHKTSIRPIKLEEVVLDLAFGKATFKYSPPPIVGDEQNYISPNNFIAIPETKERNKIHWFAAKDEHSLNEIMHVVAETVAGKVRPPQLGKGQRGRYLNQEENERWVTYWNAQQHAAEGGGEENGAQHLAASVAHPALAKPVAITVPSAKSPKLGSKQQSTPIIVVKMPDQLHTLRLEPDYNLTDQTQSDTVPVVRLVNGKRVRENVVKKPHQTNAPVQYYKPTPSPKPSPTPVPIHYHQDYKNGSDSRPTAPKYEISTYVVGQPQTTTTNIAITAPVQEHFTKHQEHEEVVTDRQKTVINVGSSERVSSKVEDSEDGVTYIETKQRSFHKSTVTTSND